MFKVFFFFKDKLLSINVSGNTADEGLLNKDLVDADSSDRIEEKRSSNKWKYGIFFAIWLICAWYLLTVREKIPTEHNIVIDSRHERSMHQKKIFFFSKKIVND